MISPTRACSPDPFAWPGLARLVQVRGVVAVPPGCDTAGLLAHVMADLQARGCSAHRSADGVLLIEGRSEGRGSVLAVIDGGWIRLSPHGAGCVLEYGFSTLGLLWVCAGLSVVAAGLTWYTLDSPELAAFWLLAPVLWLYGANRVLTGIRVPTLLERLCRSAPRKVLGQDQVLGRRPGPWDKQP